MAKSLPRTRIDQLPWFSCPHPREIDWARRSIHFDRALVRLQVAKHALASLDRHDWTWARCGGVVWLRGFTERHIQNQLDAARDRDRARHGMRGQSEAIPTCPTMAQSRRCSLLDGHVRDDLASQRRRPGFLGPGSNHRSGWPSSQPWHAAGWRSSLAATGWPRRLWMRAVAAGGEVGRRGPAAAGPGLLDDGPA